MWRCDRCRGRIFSVAIVVSTGVSILARHRRYVYPPLPPPPNAHIAARDAAARTAANTARSHADRRQADAQGGRGPQGGSEEEAQEEDGRCAAACRRRAAAATAAARTGRRWSSSSRCAWRVLRGLLLCWMLLTAVPSARSVAQALLARMHASAEHGTPACAGAPHAVRRARRRQQRSVPTHACARHAPTHRVHVPCRPQQWQR